MSIEFLRVLAKHPMPATLTDPHDVDNLLVLRAAGLVAALTLKLDAGGPEVGRFLALTPDGRSALEAPVDSFKRGAQSVPQLPQ